MARPSKYDPSYCQIAEDYLAEGYSKNTVSAKLDIHKDTLYEWIKVHPEFSDSISKGMARGQQMFETLLLEKTKNKRNNTHENLLMFTLKTRFKDTYSDRTEVVHSGESKIVLDKQDDKL